jgi:hypothetical protein
VLTDLSITGKVAQFGRGAMADISDKLLAQFVENLNTLIGEQQASPAPAAPAPAAATTEEDEAPQIRKIDAPEAEALDLLSVSSGAIVKRAIPVVIAIAAVVIWLVVR